MARTHEFGPLGERYVAITHRDGGEALRLRLPLLASHQAWFGDPDHSPALFPESLGRQLIVLIQAGAVCLGLWDGADLAAHKVFKRYVVRGRGRAQTTHLKTRGKSRFGSRLRLQNARRLLDETEARVAEWRREHGAFQSVFYSCPVRLWAQYKPALVAHFAELEPPDLADLPPSARSSVVKIPMDVHVPGHQELLRVRRFLERGWLEVATPASP